MSLRTQPYLTTTARPEAPPQELPDTPERRAMVAAHERRKCWAVRTCRRESLTAAPPS